MRERFLARRCKASKGRARCVLARQCRQSRSGRVMVWSDLSAFVGAGQRTAGWAERRKARRVDVSLGQSERDVARRCRQRGARHVFAGHCWPRLVVGWHGDARQALRGSEMSGEARQVVLRHRMARP